MLAPDCVHQCERMCGVDTLQQFFLQRYSAMGCGADARLVHYAEGEQQDALSIDNFPCGLTSRLFPIAIPFQPELLPLQNSTSIQIPTSG